MDKRNIMKFLGVLCCVMALAGCGGDGLREFIPGSYVNSAGGEFAQASDTLSVELLQGEHYVVHRRTGYRMNTDTGLGPRQWESELWHCRYDGKLKVLRELRHGKELVFLPEKRQLMVGRRVYRKLD